MSTAPSSPAHSTPAHPATAHPAPADAEHTGRPARTLPREEWPMVLGFAGVWLVFLLMAVAAATADRVQAGDTGSAVAVVATGLAFAAVYLAAFIAPQPIPSWPRPANTAAYTLALLAVTALFAVVAGATALNVLPYFTALWIFSQRRRIALIAAAVVVALGVTMIQLLTAGGQRFWLTVAMIMATAVMMAVRLAADSEDSMKAVRHELDLWRQREELARDVHDVLGHSLTAVHVKAQLVTRLIDADPARAKDEAEQIVALTRTAIGEVRSTVDGLSAPQLATELAGARRVLSDAGIRADVPGVEAAADVPERAASLFAWALREAVTNAVRHSGAERVRVELTPHRLAVVDDGVGPDGTAGTPTPSPAPTATTASSTPVSGTSSPSGEAAGKATLRTPATAPSSGSTARRGTGLAGLRARAEAAGGTLEVSAEHPGAARPGTRLEVTL